MFSVDHNWRSRSIAFVSGVGLAYAMACEPNAEERCYAPNPDLDYDGPPHQLPFCGVSPGDTPSGPDGTFTHKGRVCVEVGEDDDCDPCDVDRIEELLLEEIATDCSKPVEELLLGCYAKSERDGKFECCYKAFYFSACDEPLWED